MRTCIAYYSRTGNTQTAAEYLAEKLGAEAIALHDTADYSGMIGFVKGGMFASLGKQARLGQDVFDVIAAFDRIVLATPVWAGKTTPAINAVLAHVDWTGKAVYALTTQADPACRDAEKREAFYRRAVEAKQGTFVALFSMYGAPPNKAAAREDIRRRVDSGVDLRLF